MKTDALKRLRALRGELPRYESPCDLPADWRCEFLERAAIREYDGQQPREHAESEAFTELLVRMRADTSPDSGQIGQNDVPPGWSRAAWIEAVG